jgi:hypothetical protein
MMENLRSEIWTTNELLHRETGARSLWLYGREEAEAPPPRPGEIVRNIALMLAAHIAVVTIIVLALNWSGIH